MPAEWLVKAVLLGPAPVRKAAAARTTDERQRWMLRQPEEVRRSFVRDVMEKGGSPEAWMLLQPDSVRRSYVAEVLGQSG
jgi:hypothetical protein